MTAAERQRPEGLIEGSGRAGESRALTSTLALRPGQIVGFAVIATQDQPGGLPRRGLSSPEVYASMAEAERERVRAQAHADIDADLDGQWEFQVVALEVMGQITA